jgi:hypothetical protein
LPDGLTADMTIYRFYAQNYHWTPDVVDRLSLYQMEWFPIMEEAANDAQEVIQDQENQRNQR